MQHEASVTEYPFDSEEEISLAHLQKASNKTVSRNSYQELLPTPDMKQTVITKIPGKKL